MGRTTVRLIKVGKHWYLLDAHKLTLVSMLAKSKGRANSIQPVTLTAYRKLAAQLGVQTINNYQLVTLSLDRKGKVLSGSEFDRFSFIPLKEKTLRQRAKQFHRTSRSKKPVNPNKR